MSTQRDTRPMWVSLLLLCALLGALGLRHGLWTPDEPREAEIGREMALVPTVIPTLNGRQFIEKPPLYYWVVAGVHRVVGEPSVTAARAVSAVSGLATLLCLYGWAARAGRRRAGFLAAFMLATSLQFLVSTHWILIDPLLMLFTTLAAWAGWELLFGVATKRWALLLYAALAAALWTKGLIGVVLIVAGLLACLLVGRADWRRLRPFSGIAFLIVMTGVLGAAIWRSGGFEALWEWGWVNHVQRLVSPKETGHRQPILYYAWTLPYAMLPWLVPLVDTLRPSQWRKDAPDAALRRYAGVLVAAMLLILSASATKREIYLLPLLPPLFLLLGLQLERWWEEWNTLGRGPLGWRWWMQYALLALIGLAPALLALVYLRRPDARALLAFSVVLAILVYTLILALRGRRVSAGRAALGCAWAGAAALLLLAPHVIDAQKDMAPFVHWIDGRLPPGEPVHAINVDETLEAIVPFVSGRKLIVLAAPMPASATDLPAWVVVQDKDGIARATVLGGCTLVHRAQYGRGRVLSLWHCGPA